MKAKGLPRKEINKKVAEIQNLVNQGFNFKQVANKLNLDLGFVMAMVKSRGIKQPVIVTSNNESTDTITIEDSTKEKEEPHMNREMRRKMRREMKQQHQMESKASKIQEVIDSMEVVKQPVAAAIIVNNVEKKEELITPSPVVVDEFKDEQKEDAEVASTSSEAKKKKRKFISVQKATKIREALDRGERLCDICREFDVCYASVYNIRDGYTGHNRRKKTNSGSKNVTTSLSNVVEEVASEAIISDTNAKENPEKENSSNNIKFNDFHKLFGLDMVKNLSTIDDATPTVEVGLIADRHDMPVSNFIFGEALSEELMFDYQEQENICNRFIDKHFTFDENGKPVEVMVLYVTGFQSSLATVIKVCYERNVMLALKHYNARNKMYETQYISLDKSVKLDRNICEAIRFIDSKMKQGVFFYKSTVDDYNINEDEFYMITVSKVNENETFYERCSVICRNYSEIWEIYPNIIKQINYNNDVKLAVFVTNSYIKDGKFSFGSHVTKGFNFK